MKKHKTIETNEQYHSNDEYISSSALKKYKESPEKYRYYIDSEHKSTPAMVFGSLYHTLLLEPTKLDEEYIVFDPEKRPESDKTMGSKLNKEWKKRFDNTDKTVVKIEEVNQVYAMKDRLTEHPQLTDLLDKGLNEESYYVDDFHGAKVKVRPDKVTKNAIIDLKTTRDASVESFTKSAYNFGYHVQSAFYTDILKLFDGIERQFIFVVQEKTEPFSYQLFRATDEFINYGRLIYRELLDLHLDCINKGEWGGYEVFNKVSKYGVQDLELPNWVE